MLKQHCVMYESKLGKAIEIVYLVASQFVYDINNIGLNIYSGTICELAKKRKYG